MRIISVYYTHKPGGFCKRLYRLLGALAERGHDVTYYTLDRPPNSLSSKVRIAYIPFPFLFRRGLLFWGLFTIWCPLYLMLKARQNRPERILVFGAYYGFMCALLRKTSSAKLVLFLRSLVFKIDKITGKPLPIRLLAARVEKAGMRRADKLVLMTESMKAELEPFLNGKLPTYSILPNEVPARSVQSEALPAQFQSLLNQHQKDYLLLCSGVLDERKNIAFLIEVFEKLRDKPLVLLIAGDGPLLAKLKSMTAGLKIYFLGWQTNMSGILQHVDLVLHPSLHEGVPNSILEALAADLPVLASDIPEHRELLVENSLLFDLQDPQGLAAYLSALGDPQLEELRQCCAKRRRELSFDWEQKACDLVLG